MSFSTSAPSDFCARPGDRIVIRPHRLGEPARDGEILEVLGEGGRPPYVVRWSDDGHVSRTFPGSDAFVESFRGTFEEPRRARVRVVDRAR